MLILLILRTLYVKTAQQLVEVEAGLGGVKDKEERVSHLHENHSGGCLLSLLLVIATR